MPGAPHAEPFFPLAGRCLRMVAHPGEDDATDCPERVAWRGSWRAPNGRRYRIEACEGPPPPHEGRTPPASVNDGRKRVLLAFLWVA
jgi:hypothetical protein